jgi:hypothetical protein
MEAAMSAAADDLHARLQAHLTRLGDQARCPGCGAPVPGPAQVLEQFVCRCNGWRLVTGLRVCPVAGPPGTLPRVVRLAAPCWFQIVPQAGTAQTMAATVPAGAGEAKRQRPTGRGMSKVEEKIKCRLLSGPALTTHKAIADAVPCSEKQVGRLFKASATLSDAWRAHLDKHGCLPRRGHRLRGPCGEDWGLEATAR